MSLIAAFGAQNTEAVGSPIMDVLTGGICVALIDAVLKGLCYELFDPGQPRPELMTALYVEKNTVR